MRAWFACTIAFGSACGLSGIRARFLTFVRSAMSFVRSGVHPIRNDDRLRRSAVDKASPTGPRLAVYQECSLFPIIIDSIFSNHISFPLVLFVHHPRAKGPPMDSGYYAAMTGLIART